MVYKTNCCCGRDGLCTTRWYPIGGVSYAGNPDDCFVYDHGKSTFRIAASLIDTDWFTWVCSNDLVSKIPLPDGADPIASFRKAIYYEPPAGAVGESIGRGALDIREMRSVNDGYDHTVIIGAHVNTRLIDPATALIPTLQFDYDIIKTDSSPYQDNATRTAMAAANEIGKCDLGYRLSGAAPGDLIEVSTGGFFRLEINQWMEGAPCGNLVFTNDDAVGTVAWTSPEGAEDDGGGIAFATGEDEFSNYLRGYVNLINCIPDDALSIDGIKITIKRMASDDSSTVNVKDEIVRLRNGGTDSDNKAETSTKWPTSFESKDYGGATDLWGISWAVNDARLFSILLQVEFGNNGVDASVDLVTVVVYYTDADGDPQITTPNDISVFSPASEFYSLRNFAGDGDLSLIGSGVITDYLTEPIPLDISGADLATILQGYLDAPYTVSGTGSMTDTTDITLTFTHDGSIDSAYSQTSGKANFLVGIAVVHAFPDEAATIHMIDAAGDINWSRCGSQNAQFNGYSGLFAGGFAQWNSRLVSKIVTFGEGYDTLTVFGGGIYPVNQFNFEGDPQDCGSYNGLGGGVTGNLTTDRRSWKWVDINGNGWSQGQDLTIHKYGPTGLDAQYNLIASLPTSIAIQYVAISDSTIAFAGFDQEELVYKAGVIDNPLAGGPFTIAWATEIPSNGIWFKQARDCWTDGSVVEVAANHGCYEFDVDTGDLLAYYPHGSNCYSAMKIITGDENWLALTGATADIDPDPSTYDIDPETLT